MTASILSSTRLPRSRSLVSADHKGSTPFESLLTLNLSTVPRRERSESFAQTRQAVVTIVALSVDLDPKLMPQSATKLAPRLASGIPFEELTPTDISNNLGTGLLQTTPDVSDRVPLASPAIGDEIDDFAIMDEHQVKRITSIIKQAFDVELSMDMILANTNVSAIAKRVRDSRRLLVDEVGTNTASG